MRKSGICTKCNHNQLIAIGGIADTGEWDTEIRELHLAIRFAGEGFFGDEKRTRAGKLSAMMCRACGYTELYVLDPEAVQPDGKYVFEVNGPDRKAPYR